MKRTIIAAAAAIALVSLTAASCTSVPTPAELSDRTTVDEQAALSVEVAYRGAALAAEIAVDSGVLKGEAAAKAAVIDEKAYQAVQTVRRAYQAGNAADYAVAVEQARNAVGELIALIKGERR